MSFLLSLLFCLGATLERGGGEVGEGLGELLPPWKSQNLLIGEGEGIVGGEDQIGATHQNLRAQLALLISNIKYVRNI